MKENTTSYWPLAALILVALLAATALCFGSYWSMRLWMHYFMGLIFTQFSLLKLFDISGFADGFQMYDIVAKRYRSYALFYPFIELFLGLLYLSFFSPVMTYVVTVVVMTVGSYGVIKAIRKKLDISCACMGSVLKVPLSTVSLTEDLGMGFMALSLLFI